MEWRAPDGDLPVRHDELHQPLPEGKRRFLDGTSGTAYYVPALRRTAGEAETRLEVRAVGAAFAASAAAALAYRW
ncbi:GH85 family endohexosaminidase C-terminal domain-containing protein [Streptomyces sp. 8N616]|uniref:GH85 family endohexosaminidase C-terminal domain-containing protein n=1 Tax=Streptomyces sp. 8N616 TaxID=3457414 RepID=UPI003FCF4C03